MGHVPLLADPCFAQFSQEIGLASLGASDDEISKLATVSETLQIFNISSAISSPSSSVFASRTAKCASSELDSCRRQPKSVIWKHALSSKAEILPFDPVRTSQQECLITTFQDVYFYSESHGLACVCREFAATIRRTFGVRYNPYTQTVDVLSTAQKIALLVSELKGDLCIVSNALRKIKEHDSESHDGVPPAKQIP